MVSHSLMSLLLQMSFKFFSLIGNIQNLGFDQVFITPSFCMRIYPVSELENHTILPKVQNKTSSSVDGKNNFIVESSSFAIVPVLKPLTELSSESRNFLSYLAQAVVCLLYKDGSKIAISN